MATALPQLLGFYEMVPEVNSDWLQHLQQLIDINRHFVSSHLLVSNTDDVLIMLIDGVVGRVNS